jgi:hypothetical protein
MNLKLQQPKPKLQILNPNNQTKNLFKDDKHDPQVKILVLNWHNHNLIIITEAMLKVLLE